MYKVDFKFVSKEPIIDVAIWNKQYLFFDMEKNIFICDKEYNVISKSVIKEEVIGLFDYSHALCAKRNTITLPLKDDNKILVCELDENGCIAQSKNLAWHTAQVSCSSISSDGAYIATAGMDGKLFIFEKEGVNPISSIGPRPDYVSLITFSKESKFLFAAWYDNINMIYNLERNIVETAFTTNDNVEVAAFIEDASKLIYGTRDGSFVVYSLYEKKIILKENFFTAWPCSMEITPDEKFAFVGTRDGKLHLYDLGKMEYILKISVSNSGIKKILLNDNILVVLTTKGFVQFIDTTYRKDDFIIEYKVKNYWKVKILLEENAFLNTSFEVPKNKNMFNDIKDEIIDLVSISEFEKASDLAGPFLIGDEISEDIKLIFENQKYVQLFNESIKTHDIATVYQLAFKFPFLKVFSGYKRIEKEWKNTYEKAVKLISQPQEAEKVKKLILPYEKIAVKKRYLDFLLDKKDVILNAMNLLAKNDLSRFFKIADEYPQLKELNFYLTILDKIENRFNEALRCEENEQFEKAKEIYEGLLNQHPDKQKIKEALIKAGHKERFNNLVKQNKIKEAYELIEEYSDFIALRSYKQIEKSLENVIKEAKKSAYQGKPSKCIEILKDYMDIKYVYDKVVSIIKISYIKEIQNNLSAIKKEAWPAIFEKYVKIFGKDAEIDTIASKNFVKDFLDILDDNKAAIPVFPNTIIELPA